MQSVSSCSSIGRFEYVIFIVYSIIISFFYGRMDGGWIVFHHWFVFRFTGCEYKDNLNVKLQKKGDMNKKSEEGNDNENWE